MSKSNAKPAQVTPAPKADEKKAPAETPFRKMVVRSVVGLIMLGFFGFMINIDHIYFEILIIVGQIVTWREVVSIRYNDIKEMKLRLFRTLNWCVVFLSCILDDLILRYWIFVAFYFFYAKQLLVLAKTSGSPVFAKHLATINFMLDYNPLICFVLYLIGMLMSSPPLSVSPRSVGDVCVCAGTRYAEVPNPATGVDCVLPAIGRWTEYDS
jgi:CDP-diglyceride synthetase